MKPGQFAEVAITDKHPDWEIFSSRLLSLYRREDDIRSPFARDYNRILHCTAYRRLKHKTQVFFAPTNDHICTRIEHVNHVTAVSYTLAKYLGLNTELTNAIALGHDLGHAPFGHAGEDILKNIAINEIDEAFWHEKNSLRFVDKCETLEDPCGNLQNLNLTYAVRDGIVCHCGEVDENNIFPRKQLIDLDEIQEPNKFISATWEGCVVKIADKIAYLGRDIEDALSLKILSLTQVKGLIRSVRPYTDSRISELNTTVLMHDFIIDLCKNSAPHIGISLSPKSLGLMNAVKKFNNENIYNHWRIKNYRDYAELIINSIYNMLKRFYCKDKTLEEIKRYNAIYPVLSEVFYEWQLKYARSNQRPSRFKNTILYDLTSEDHYRHSIIDFISGMTDVFAIKVFEEIISF